MIRIYHVHDETVTEIDPKSFLAPLGEEPSRERLLAMGSLIADMAELWCFGETFVEIECGGDDGSGNRERIVLHCNDDGDSIGVVETQYDITPPMDLWHDDEKTTVVEHFPTIIDECVLGGMTSSTIQSELAN